MSATLSVFTLYRDPAAAVRWLEAAFGFEVVNEWSDHDGILQHAELRLGEAVVVIEVAAHGQGAAPLIAGSTNRAPVLSLDGDDAAVDALFRRAERAGATVVRRPEKTEWGNHRFEVLDPEGHQWSVGTYKPGVSWD